MIGFKNLLKGTKEIVKGIVKVIVSLIYITLCFFEKICIVMRKTSVVLTVELVIFALTFFHLITFVTFIKWIVALLIINFINTAYYGYDETNEKQD